MAMTAAERESVKNLREQVRTLKARLAHIEQYLREKHGVKRLRISTMTIHGEVPPATARKMKKDFSRLGQRKAVAKWQEQGFNRTQILRVKNS